MRLILKFVKDILTSITRGKRFIRLSPFNKGKIFFYDKMKNSFFSIVIRDKIDSITADQVITNDQYDLKFLKRYDELLEKYNRILALNKVPLIIDCGANIGLSAYNFSVTFPDSIVVAIEPEINNYSLIKKNCKSLNNVELLNKAVGSLNGFVNIDNPKSDNNAFRTSRNANSERLIEIITINDILSAHNELIPFVIKIDIEGFEDDLFSTDTEWVKEFPILIIEPHDWMLPNQANSHNFLRVMAQQKNDFVLNGENIFSILND